MKKIICVDFDGTYTVFPEILEKTIELFKNAGHEVICTTMRYEYEVTDMLIKLQPKVSEIYFTGRKAKLPYLQQLGIFPDLWIEDNPEWLFADSE